MKTRNYSATIVIDPSGSEGSSNEMIPKLTEAIAQSDGEVNKVVELGQHDFAYPIKKNFTKGTYLQFEITGSPDTPGKIKEKLRLEKKVDRILIECSN
ncbi:MAG TPA: 30S ribosomal protein S6 [Opitutae bacterium]|jgi:ribosomal protein S6|nr:30S ribosomal protein S6 [Opitutae bacterium]HAF58198.1 30S ribosomal protein S6 [Opitutae bacterium]|tara:strand:+ start:168 stop:461 length:294 start_codon:yes stop_codon:yes gene_type:complete